jgi:predicted phosphodiesterase
MTKKHILIFCAILILSLTSCVKQDDKNLLRIAISSDNHLSDEKAYENFNKMINDMKENVSIDSLFLMGDWSTYRHETDIEAWNEIEKVRIEKYFDVHIVDGNHEWDEYIGSNRMFTFDTNSANREFWITHYPFTSSILTEDVTIDQKYIKVEDASLFSMDEKELNSQIDGLQHENMIVLKSNKNIRASMNFIERIDVENNTIYFKSNFAYPFEKGDSVFQGRDSDKIIRFLKQTQRGDINADRLSHTIVHGNNAFIMLSSEDYFKAVRIKSDTNTLVVSLSEDTLDWLETEIVKHNDKNVFVFSHWAVVGTGVFQSNERDSRNFDTITSIRIKKILSENSVVAWFNGHSHLPPEADFVQFNKPEGFGDTTFIHVPSPSGRPTSIANVSIDVELYDVHWRYFELVEGSDVLTIKTRNSSISDWLNSDYDIPLKLRYKINLKIK